jgi:tripartite ATP-independent transporter DctM subunit
MEAILATLAVAMLLMLLSGASMGAGMGLAGFALIYIFKPGAEQVLLSAVLNIFSSFAYTAIPLFILMGELIVHGGFTNRFFRLIAPAVRFVPGSFCQSIVVMSVAVASVSGSSTAGCAAVSAAIYPELKRRGFRSEAVAACMAGAGTLGILIPPSITLLLYGAWQEVSIGRLFLAGVVPGILAALCFMIYVGAHRSAFVPPDRAPQTEENIRPQAADWWACLGMAIILAAVLGSIYAGIATPTEAAGMGVLAALFAGLTLADLRRRTLRVALRRSVVNFASLKFVFIGSIILTQAVTLLGVPRYVVAEVLALELSPAVLMMAIMAMYLLLGCLFDGISMMVITLPFIAPIMKTLGYDPVWLGVFITIMIEIGAITPPFGVNLFVVKSVLGSDVTMGRLSLYAIPYWGILLAVVVLAIPFPELMLALPNLVMGN